MPEDGTPRKVLKTTLTLVTPTLVALTATIVGLCALCPITNTLFLRPVLAIFDSRYVSGKGVPPIPFDRDLWRAGRARHRVGMAEHLTMNKLLHGKTRAELVEQLGEPDDDRPEQDEVR